MSDQYPEFPMNVVDAIATRIPLALTELGAPVILRPLRPADPSRSCGIFPVDVMPENDSMEIGNFGPTIQRYSLRIHLLVRATDEVQGRAIYSVGSKKLRQMLYRDSALKVALAALRETDALGETERFMTFGIRSQKFLNNEISGQFMYLSATDVWFATETVNIGGF